MFCSQCGTENAEGNEFCSNCGKSLRTTVAAGLTNRSPIMVLLLTIITFGIYAIYWHIKTAWELKDCGADIPTAWLIIIPIISIWWMWKMCEGVELVTDGRMSTAVAFILLYLLGMIGAMIIQNSLNDVASA